MRSSCHPQRMKLIFFLSATYSIIVVPIWPPDYLISGSTSDSSQTALPAVSVWPPMNPRQSYSNRTNYGVWTQCATEGLMCPCFGYVRQVLNYKTYTAPVRVSISINCTAGGFGNYLWEGLDGSRGFCRRRNHKNLIFSSQAGCMQPGEASYGWPGPGVKEDCTFSGWVYHKYTGHIRTNDSCLTAVRPINASLVAGWLVKLMPCTMSVKSGTRQAWDLPNNVLNEIGEVPSINYAKPETLFGGVVAIKAGVVGMIRLRDSSDIGQRCLELTPGIVQVFNPALFLEAKLCEDLTTTDADRAHWSIYTKTSDETDESWKRCNDTKCSDCGQDCELLYDGGSGETTKPIGNSGPVEGGCSLDFIRNVAIPSTGNESMCICQLSGQENYTWQTLQKYVNGTVYTNPTFNYSTFPSFAQISSYSAARADHELMDACSDDLLENQYFNISGSNETSWGPPVA